MITRALLLLILINCISCSGGSSSNSDPSLGNTPLATESAVDVELLLNFERIDHPQLDSFRVDVLVLENGAATSDANITPVVSKGDISPVDNLMDGHYQFTVTPDQSGEYEVTISHLEETITRTVLVLQDTHTDWGQAQAVPGLVNTAGYEDGATITDDGEYLFVHTGPYRWSSLLVYAEPRANGGCGGARLVPDKCTHPWINEITGTLSAPERPGFYNGRFSGTTQLHNANSWAVDIDQTPNYALTTMFYGFKKQADGSFREPFYLAFDDLNDGIIGPFGLSFMKTMDNVYTAIFSLADAFTNNNGFDIYNVDAIFGQNNNLGTYELSSAGQPPNRGAYFPSKLIDLGDNNGTQGNPFLYYTQNGVQSIWTDDEYDGDADTHKLSVYVLNTGEFQTSSDWSKNVLPANVNQTATEAIQPTFLGTGLYFTQNTSIAFSAYSGEHSTAGYSNNANWDIAEIILQKDTSISSLKVNPSDIGKIVAIGEPTIAMIDGREILYFIYAYIRSIDSITGFADLDFQTGFIEKNL